MKYKKIQKESKTLALGYKRLMSQRKPYKREGNEYIINDKYSIFIEDNIISFYKSTDFDKQPQYKGEPLVKIVHEWQINDDLDVLQKVLNAISWVYL